jgi:hypothetical protein
MVQLIICAILLALVFCEPVYEKRKFIVPEVMFSKDSEASLIITACGNMEMLRETLGSFLFYNSYPLREVFIGDYCMTPEDAIR